MSYDKYRPLRARRVIKAGNDLVRDLTTPLRKKTRGVIVPIEGAHHRNPLYRAEGRIYKRMRQQYILRSLPEVHRYIEGVLSLSTAYSRRTWPIRIVQAGSDLPHYHAGVITVPIPVQQMVLLHELAHHLVGVEAQHGPKFLDAYVYLLDREIPGVSEKLLAELPDPG